MRIVAIGGVILMLSIASLDAQQPEQSFDAISRALQRSQPSSILVPRLFPAVPEGTTRLGFLTLATPDAASGEFVKVVVPIGDLTTRLTRKISSAQYRRRERKARETVERALREFQSQQVTK